MIIDTDHLVGAGADILPDFLLIQFNPVAFSKIRSAGLESAGADLEVTHHVLIDILPVPETISAGFVQNLRRQFPNPLKCGFA